MLYNTDTESIPDVYTLTEQLLLQAVFKNPSLIDEHDLKYGFFLGEPYKTIFDMVCTLHESDSPITLEFIKSNYKDVFLDEQLSDFVNALWRSRSNAIDASVAYYQKTLKDRKLKNSFESLKVICTGSENPEKDVEQLINRASDLLASHQPAASITFDETWAKVVDIGCDAELGIFPHSLRTHYESLDKVIGEGILDDYLVVIGAESGVGKTTFALNLVRNIALADKHSTLYLSFEMGRNRLMRWFMAACTEIPMSHFTNGQLKYEQQKKLEHFRKQVLCPNPLVILETLPEISNVIKQVRAYIKSYPECRMIVIDHLHLMTSDKFTNPTDVVSSITNALKALTMELSVPIILLSQLKKPEAPLPLGQVRDPHVSLLKGSGSIITDADLIMILQNDPGNIPGANCRLVRNHVLKNRGGEANGAWVGFAMYADRCVMRCN